MARGSPTGSRGAAYVLLLIALAALSVVAASSLSLGAAMGRRTAERELLAIGAEFQQALQSYAGLPAGAPATRGARGPRTIEELLRDPRVPGVRRHLRQWYADPLTGRAEWGLLRDGEGFIVGIHSLAPGRPLQRTGFEPRFAAFEQAEGYAGWVFGLLPAAPLAPRPGSAP